MRTEGDVFDVELQPTDSGWRVVIVDGTGNVRSERACRDHSEARTFASTVRQHAYWLSPERFSEYYGIEEA